MLIRGILRGGVAVLGWVLAGVAGAEPVPLEPVPGLPFRDHAVLQQQVPLPVWGTTLPGAEVRVRFDGQDMATIADAEGRWRVVLEPLTAVKLKSVNESPQGGMMVITAAKGGETATLKIRDLLVGEVWLCAGQSNMAGKMRTTTSRHFPPDSIAKADYPALRQWVSPTDGPWLVCSPETAPEFKKVCFFFARRVLCEILVPVGVINAAVGGSRIETWLNRRPYETGKHYTEQIDPLLGYGLRGMVWYQGESNAKDGRAYLPKLRSLILGWREAWDQADSATDEGPKHDFPVYFVQLPGIGTSPTDDPAGGDGRAGIRQAYLDALAIPNTGMAVTLDIGDVREHPPNKYDTGVRLASLALHRDYGLTDLVPCGPLYKSHQVEGRAIRIRFDHAEGGLMIAWKQGFPPPQPRPEARLGWLAIRGKRGDWHWADATLDGGDLMVSSPEVEHPVAVRYAFTNHPTGPLLYNREGLPASPFATDLHPETE